MSAPLKVSIVGEGPNDLGGWARRPPYQDRSQPGAIEALLKRLRAEGWQVAHARCWKDRGRNLKVGGRPGEHGDARRTRIAALDAAEAGCDALIFLRDEDWDGARAAAIQEGVESARGQHPHLRIAGGLVVPKLEGWILALCGGVGTESLRPKALAARLEAAGISAKDTCAMVEKVESADMDALPADAHSLRRWLADAEGALSP